MKDCAATLANKFTINKGKDPCSIVNKGSYKKANICEKLPYVYYTPKGSKKEFKEAIQDLELIDKFDGRIKKYYMSPLCVLEKGVPGKTDQKTVVVSKLVDMLSVLEKKPKVLINNYIEFVTGYLKEVSKFGPSEIWRIVSTDFKPDNLMIDKDTDNILITDFSPMRKNRDGTFGCIVTPVFVFDYNYKDYSSNKKYTDLEASKIAYHTCLLAMLVTLFYFLGVAEYIKDGLSTEKADDKILTKVEKMPFKQAKTLHDRQILILKELRSMFKTQVDMSVIESWVTINPFGRKASTIHQAKTSEKKSPKISPRGRSSEGSSTKCSKFLSSIKSRATTVVNPLTGRKIMTRTANGVYTPLIKKIIRSCE